MKLKFATTDISLNETPRKMIPSKGKQGQKGHSFLMFMFFVSLCLWDGNFDCNTLIKLINIHCFLPEVSIDEKERLGFPNNIQWSRLTDWQGLNLIQELDRHILEAYVSLCRFPRSKAYMFFLDLPH